MPIQNVKFTPTSYDSINNSPPWRDFSSQFESFVMYQTHGAALIALVDHILQRERVLTASSQLDAGILLTEDQVAAFNRVATAHQVDNGEIEIRTREITAYEHLNVDETKLDGALCNILDGCITGPLRTALAGVQVRSFIQAWVLLQKDKGAHNSQRKTELIAKLMGITYPSMENKVQSPTEFKASTLSIVRELYDARVTLEDIIMTSIMNSLPREYQNAKISLAEKIDDDSKDDKDVYEYIQHTTNILELIAPPKEWENGALKKANQINALKTAMQNACHRCWRTNHKLKDCFASRHVDGHKLEDLPPGSKPKKTSAGREHKALLVTTEEERTKCLDKARQILRRTESM